jgi:hypothetical protein
MTVAKQIENVGGRRFFLVLGAGLVNTLLLMGGYLTEDNYVVLTLATVGAYIAGNGAQRYIEKKYDPAISKSAGG